MTDQAHLVPVHERADPHATSMGVQMVREVPQPVTFAGRRALLAELLNEAAELEHSLLVTYLFAVFSLKLDVSEGGVSYRQLELMRQWRATILRVARQEMEHLGIVCNLLTSIGEAPRMRTR